ncbi:hypothetical protein CHL76_02270 [Marinococcus halophilus]|uniref:CopG family transcriptional regulator n=1 Tax=Marinococcus halophilus TaxID=1371 RepID=A0A510Y1D7_MARHA|nr:hypothetical protein [Marinococcus halophilus]OZT81202.1 hypothetical protein CHL76_02270 [Marinococcus halophilus]GEK57135.1 hypothetical protein MHA01_00400 [Marinococcus halophilus]
MAKKPFSVRVEADVVKRFKAIATVKNIDSAQMLSEMLVREETELSEEEHQAYLQLMSIWKD